MRRRDLLTLLGSAAAAWAFAAGAQQPAVPVIGFLGARSVEPDERRRAFRQGLKDNGFVEGENVVIDYRFGGIQMERVLELLDELVRRRVAVIVATSGPIAVLASQRRPARCFLRARRLPPISHKDMFMCRWSRASG